MMLIFSIPIQLGVKYLIAQSISNSQHIPAIASELLVIYRAYSI